MKRLLSWLLVLVMVIGLLPMSAFAATDVDWEVNDEDMDIIVDFGGELNPIDLTEDLRADMTATVTVPAGKIYYFTASCIANGMEMAITGLDPVICSVAPGAAYTWSIDNSNGEADAEYVITISFPEGHMENPKVIEEMNWYSDEVTQAAGDNDGFFYTYTAVADGVVTLYFYPEYDDEGNIIEGSVRDIMVTNMTTYAQYSLLNDGVDNYGMELQIPVAAGNVLSINTAYLADAAGNSYPAATYSWTGNFAYPAGSEQNPIAIEWVWDEAYANATASVTTEADGTYYMGNAGMILTVDGNVVEMDEAGNFVLSAGTHELALATPVGAYNNPEVIENIDGYSDTNSLKAEANYNYVWTATEDGTVTLDITDGANIIVNKVIGVSEDGWDITEQFELATVEYDDSWNASWVVAENLVIEVLAGQKLNIQVNGLTDFETYSTPAIDYTLTGEFEGAVVAPEYNVTTSAYGLALDAELIVSCKLLLPDALKTDPNAVIKVEFVNEVIEYNVVDYIAENGVDSKGRIKIGQSVKSFWMTHTVTITITDGNGYTANFTDYFGNTHTGSYEFGIDEYVKTMAAAGEPTVNAVRALLTYGSYSQIHFKGEGTQYITDELATEILTRNGYEAYDISGFSRDMLSQKTTSEGDSFDGISIRGGTPDLAAAIFMKVQFNASGVNSESDLANYTYKLTYKSGTTSFEEELEASYDANRKRLVFYVNRIPAMLFDEMYSITITKTETGETYTGSTSILAYLGEAYDVFNASATYDQDMLNLISAMYYYNQADNALFGK